MLFLFVMLTDSVKTSKVGRTGGVALSNVIPVFFEVIDLSAGVLCERNSFLQYTCRCNSFSRVKDSSC